MMRAWTLAMLLLCAAGCRETNAASAPAGSTIPEGSAVAPAFTREGGEAEPAAPSNDAEAPPEPAAEAAEVAKEGESAPSQDPTEAPSTEPLPNVEILNVGMHIGGEDNTAEQKRPIRAEVAKHYDDMRRCYAKAVDPGRKATFGVDMRIVGAGGPAKITNPRSGLKGEGVKECLVQVFEAIEFPRQPRGTDRMVSFSIEFRRK
jgi:hypothetical protein